MGIWRDLVYAGRSLAKARAFTFVCVVSLGIGMAPVIAIPYAARISKIPPSGVNTEGLVEVLTTPLGSRGADDTWSYPDFVDLRDADTGMVMTGWAIGESEVTPQTPAEAKAASTMFVSSDYFRAIGVTLVRGPGFDAKRDAAFTAEAVVILGYRFWQNRLGSDPDIVGKTLTLDGTPHVVVGIAPDQFDGIDTKELFVPLERHPRLRPGKNADNNVRADRDNEVGAHPRPPVARSGPCAGERSRFWCHIAAGQTVPGHQRAHGGHRQGVRPHRKSRASPNSDSRGRRTHADRNGAPGRVPEYLRHDAGSQRDARA